MLTEINSYRMRITALLLLLVMIIAGICSAGLLAADRFANKPVRRLEMTLGYDVSIRGSKKTKFNIVSLIPVSVKGRQEISNLRFSPEPERVYEEDGRKYAEWEFDGRVGAGSINRLIEVSFDAVIYQQNLDEKKTVEILSTGEKKRYLRSEDYIRLRSKNLVRAVAEIPKKDSDYEQVKAILRYVKKRMRPTKATRKMLGAQKALQKGEGDCTEYTDLFVALARLSGLPAKHVSGYLVNSSQGIGHSWVEVYTRDCGWIYVDPLHMDLGMGTFERLENKYLLFSAERSDQRIKNGMLYYWWVNNGTGGRVYVRLKCKEKW